MNQETSVYELAMPEYTVSSKPDYQAVGYKMDEKIQSIFSGRPLIMRALTVADHPGKSLDDLVQIILELGYDRYDPQRKGVGYPGGIQDALYAGLYEGADAMARVIRLFYTGPPADRNEPPIRLDLLLFYDPAKMKRAPWIWNEELQREVPASHLDPFKTEDGGLLWFRDPEDKSSALLGLLKILR